MQTIIEGARLSPRQRYLWLLQRAGGAIPYRVQCAIRIGGHIDADVLRQSLTAVVERHEILHVKFHGLPNLMYPLQGVSSEVIVKIRSCDLGALDNPQQARELIRVQEAERLNEFDFENGPVMHAVYVRFGYYDHALVLTLPAICIDVVSLQNLTYELAFLYEAHWTAALLAPPPVQYLDISEMLNNIIQSDQAKSQREYWRQSCAPGACGVSVAGIDPLRQPTFAVRCHPLRISEAIGLRIEESAIALKVDVTAILIACLHVLLYRTSGKARSTIAMAINGRTYEELKDAIGPFTEYLPTSLELHEEARFGELAQIVQESISEVTAFQDSFDWNHFVEAGDTSETARFFSYLVDYENTKLSIPAGSVEFRITDLYSCEARFNVRLSFTNASGILSGCLYYNAEELDRPAALEFARSYETLLESVVDGLNARVGELNILGEEGRHRLLTAFNNTAITFSDTRCIHEIFEDRAEATPDIVAVSCEDRQITYGELDSRANQLANYLRALGVSRDDLVGVCLERSVDMVRSLLGIIKVGAAYVPLDPEYPVERLTFMIADSRLRFLLTDGLCPELRNEATLIIDLCAEQDEIERMSYETPMTALSTENLAYAMYTSGSTGRPKCVMIPHNALSNHMQWMQRVWPLTKDDRVLQKTPFSFDASVWEFWAPLLAGARLVMARPGGERESRYLVNSVCEYQITRLQVVPSMLRALLDEPNLNECCCLQKVYCGGEALSRDLRDRFTLSLDAGLYNLYGPTESTVEVTSWDCRQDSSCTTVPIGQPIDNIQIYILDGNMEPTPVDAPGELNIGGECLARGYWKDPGLTAEKFIPNPFCSRGGARLYRSGDLARWLPSGNVEYLGRLDHQVKIHGYRIELGEVEAALASHPEVREAIVAPEKSGQRLAAYVVGVSKELQAEQLRTHLSQQLPSYMIPATFVFLDRLPLTPNGKLDREALSLFNATPSAKGYIAPRTEMEILLERIWGRLLGLDKVSVLDNFFELGGDSILSIQMAARAREAGVQLAPKMLFQHQTIAELSSVAQAVTDKEPHGQLYGRASLTAIQQWFFHQNWKDPHYFNQSLLLEACERIDGIALRRALMQLLEHHDALRMRYERQEKGWRQWSAPFEPQSVFCRVDLEAIPDKNHGIKAVAERVQRSLNLSTGPLVRFVLFECGPENRAQLLLVIHHLVVDGVSWRILLDDLEQLYQQARNGVSLKLPHKTTPFQEWAGQAQQRARSEEILRESSFWMEESCRSAARLPVDHAIGANTFGSARQIRWKLSVEETRCLLERRIYGAQLQEALLASLALGLARWTTDKRRLVDIEGHGREEIGGGLDVSRTVGWFTTVYPMLLDLNGVESDEAAVRKVRDQLGQAPARGLGYGLLRYLSGRTEIQQYLERLPQSEVSFNYLGQLNAVTAGGVWKLAQEGIGPLQSPMDDRYYLLDVNSFVLNQQLYVEWAYSQNVHRRETIEGVAESCRLILRKMVAEGGARGNRSQAHRHLDLTDVATLDRLRRQGVIEDVYRLAPLQHGLLFHTLYAAKPYVYCEQFLCSLKGPLQPETFRRAWQHALERHDVLRSALLWEGMAEPVQIVWSHAEMEWEEKDWRGYSDDERRQILREALETDRERGFELSRAPLMRAALFSTGSGEYQFLWSHHHAILDGWSVALLVKEVFERYEAYRHGREFKSIAVRPYGDYIAWLQRQEREKDEEYWRRYLQGVSTPSLLCNAPPMKFSAGNAEQKMAIDPRLTSTLRAVARKRRLTLNTLLQGLWALIVSRCSGRQDVVFGNTVSCRPADLVGVESMIGLFINTVPVRAQIRPEVSLESWLRHLQNEQAEMREHAHAPLLDIQRWSNLPRRTTMFDSLFIFENYPLESSITKWVGDVQIQDLRFITPDHFPITVLGSAWDSSLMISVLYDDIYFTERFIREILDYFAQALNAIAIQPQISVGDLLKLFVNFPEIFQFKKDEAESE